MNVAFLKEGFEELKFANNGMGTISRKALTAFQQMGIPTSRHEEWKYTRISSLFNKEYQLSVSQKLSASDLNAIRLPGYEQANELFFINGVYAPEFSTIRSGELTILPLEEAWEGPYAEVISQHLGQSSRYLKDGMNALNTIFAGNGLFIQIQKEATVEHPVFIYHLTDSRSSNILSQPRSLVHIAEGAEVQLTETYASLGSGESLTNQILEVVVEKGARLEYYKIQNDAAHTNLVSTTHIRQTGKSHVHTVTLSLNGNIIRNNLNLVLDAEYCEAHLYGLYLLKGNSHIDNHTIVDNVKPHCYSNELFKGVMDENATGVFNGKIFVQPQAQKTNAYQSNKNILLTDTANVYTKPQLEIFADDVKCSHGCTVGRLNEEGLFYLRSRGIEENVARSLLLHAFAADILEQIKPKGLRAYVKQLISQRLECDLQ